MSHFTSGFFASKPDNRFSSLDDSVRLLESQIPQPFRTVSDAGRSALGNFLAAEPGGREVGGFVTHSIPALGWYRVQTATAGVISCTVDSAHVVPTGVQEVKTIPAGSGVTVRLNPLLPYGTITGTLPTPCCDDRVSTADFVQPGSGVGYRREQFHTYPLQGLSNAGGAADFLPGMPVDLLAGDRGFISANGLRLLVSDFSVQVAANEMCGLYFTYLDDFCRFAARNYLFESGAAEERHTSDEGELHAYRGTGLYPWEVLGLYSRGGGTLTAQQPDLDVLYAKHVSPVDLTLPNRDAQPIFRFEEHSSYPANGISRSVSVPVGTGVRKASGGAANPDDAIGVFREHVAPTGQYSAASAHGFLWAKRCLIPIPRQLKAAPDPAGDDAEADNYRFSGTFGGGGAPHLVRDFPAAGSQPGLAALLAADDALAFHLNWTALAGFHYHGNDWKVGEESANPQFSGAQAPLDYSQPSLDPPPPVYLNVDPRYGNVNYYETVSFIQILPDGGIAIADGYGATVRLCAGLLLLDAPKDIRISAGGTLALSGAQVVVKSQGSLDLSASTGDVRLKAENNMQFLSANSGSGGMLFESRAEGVAHDFQNKIGEDVVDSGIVFKASESHVVALSREVYLRTVGGNINLDADQGNRDIVSVCDNFSAFVDSRASFAFGPNGDDSGVSAVYYFTPDQMICDAGLSIGGELVLFGEEADVITTGSVYATGNVECAGRMADGTGGLIGKTQNLDSELQTDAGVEATSLQAIKTALEGNYSAYAAYYYAAGEIGSAATISAEQFSYRDDGGNQYGTADFTWVGARWEALARGGAASGVQPWIEMPVSYAGQDLYPWPGRAQWMEEDAYLQPAPSQFTDPGDLTAVDRGAAYESPLPPNPVPGKMSQLVKITAG